LSRRRTITWLAEDSAPDSFPDPRRAAMNEPNGLVAAGGDLSPARLLAAYRRGIFPWYGAGEPPLWWSPDPRAVLQPGNFHRSRSLLRTLRSGRFSVSVDQDFEGIIRLCAETRSATGTWLGPDMISAYCELHRLGFAHSVESWYEGKLAGGLYGVSIGRVFFGESMVSLRPDASKVALAGLVGMANQSEIALIDCQIPNEHLMRLGAMLMPRAAFLDTLAVELARAPVRPIQPAPPVPTQIARDEGS